MRSAGWRGLAAALLVAGAGVCALVPAIALAQSDPAAQLTGTLAKARATGSVSFGYRESSIPFSYLSPRGEPIGYSIDLCRHIVDAISENVGRNVTVQWKPVTSASRIDAVMSGQVDLECGSTTNNLERQKLVAFSPTFFVSGTKLLVKKGSPIRSFRDIAGKKIALTAGTTNEKTLRDLVAKFKLDTRWSSAPTTPPHSRCCRAARSTPSRPTTCFSTAWPRRTRPRPTTSSSATSSLTTRTG